MAVPSLESNKPVDNSSIETNPFHRIDEELHKAIGEDPNGPSPRPPLMQELTQMMQAAESQSVTFNASGVRERWIRALKAVRSEHFDGSKYLSEGFRHRSKLFRPKTRSALRKKMTNAAHAFFATGDVVAIQAVNESDPNAVVGAALKQELINYRLSRTSRRNGIRWFQTVMGAEFCANVYGMVLSKQSWRYIVEPGDGDEFDDLVLEDRPFIDLLKPENVRIDLNCDWLDPAQTSTYVGLMFPMTPDEAWMMIEKNEAIPWNEDLTFDQVRSWGANMGPSDTTGVRASREQNRDPQATATSAFQPIWLTEWFMRLRGVDYCFWAINNRMISTPQRVRKAYPAFFGLRPLVFGVGALEPHRVIPQSPVDSWQQLQMEINDQVNLRLDHMKKAVDPPAKVARGKNVDVGALKTSGPNRVVYMESPDNVDWMQVPDLPTSAYQENNFLQNDMDDLAGNFNGSSVASNRDLNETVGGMRLLAGSSDAVSEFDLSVFVETWAEPVIWQILKLEEMYESDVNVLMICGEKAQLWQKYGHDAITDAMMKAEANVTINLGVGSSNLPEKKLQNFQIAAQTAMQVLAPAIQAGVIQSPVPNAKAIIDEVFGSASFKDGGTRFFIFIPDEHTPPPQKQAPPDLKGQAAVMQAQNNAGKLQLDAQKHEDGKAQKQQETQLNVAQMHHEDAQQLRDLGDRERQRQADLEEARMRTRAEILAATHQSARNRMSELIGHVAKGHQQTQQHMHEYLIAKMGHDASAEQMKQRAKASPSKAA